MSRVEIEVPQEAREVIQKLDQTGLVEKYAAEGQFVPMSVAELVLTEEDMKKLNKIGSCSPEEWSGITGIKLAGQPNVIFREVKKFLDERDFLPMALGSRQPDTGNTLT